MSRAFVNEGSFVEELPDRAISNEPNLVTERGLELIEMALEAARGEYGAAEAQGDREALAKAGRELRYWSARRASAQVVRAAAGADTVQFASSVTLLRGDGRQQTFRMVGEDEADPKKGSISHVSPLARSLVNRRVGDTVLAGRHEAEIMAIS